MKQLLIIAAIVLGAISAQAQVSQSFDVEQIFLSNGDPAGFNKVQVYSTGKGFNCRQQV